jgi:hypothetical protein
MKRRQQILPRISTAPQKHAALKETLLGLG